MMDWRKGITTKITTMIDKFKWKRNTNGFDKNPENINKKWKPKRGVSLINQQLMDKWIEPISKNQAEDIMLNLMNMKKTELEELLQNPETPFLIILCIKEMLSEWKWFNAMNVMLDRGIGKAVQRQETEISGNINTTGYDLLVDIQSGKITRDNAYSAMRTAKGE